MNDLDSLYRGNTPRTTAELLEWHARASPENALEPQMPIVDPHHHLFATEGDVRYYRMQDLVGDLSTGHKVIGTVYVEAYFAGWRQSGPEALRPVGEVERIAGLTRSPLSLAHGPCRAAAGIVAYADLRLGDEVARVLEAEIAAAEGRLRGVRHIAAWDGGTVGRHIAHPVQRYLLADPGFRRGVAQLGRQGLSFDAWTYHHQLAELLDLVDACPDTRIVLDHVGGPIGIAEFRPKKADLLSKWSHDLRALAARPNVSVKVGGLGMAVFGFGFEHGAKPATSAELARAWQPYIDACIEAFGPQRCMFESNFPVDKHSCGYAELWNAYKLATRALSEDERRDMFYRTACRAYRLPELLTIGDASVLVTEAPYFSATGRGH